MKCNEKKELVLNCIKMAEDFIENYFKEIEMFIKLNEFEILENFLNYYFVDNFITIVVVLSSGIDKLYDKN